MAKNAQALICGADLKNGKVCKRATSGGPCWQHKNGKLFNPSKTANTRVLNVTDVIKTYDEYRPELKISHSAANWNVPQVKGAGARLAEYAEHLSAVRKYKKAIEGLLEKKFDGQEGDIEIGQHHITVGRRPENFSAKKAEEIFKETGLTESEKFKDYSTATLDPAKLKANHPEIYTEFSQGRGDLEFIFNKELKEEKKRHAAETYDVEKLKSYGNERLISEYRLLENEEKKYDSEIKADKNYLENALPQGTYKFDNTFGDNGNTMTIKKGNKFDRAAATNWLKTDGNKVNVKDSYSNNVTAASIKKGDKLHSTNYYTQAKNAGKDRFAFSIKED